MASVRRGPAALVLPAESDSSFWSSRNGTKRRPASGPGEDSRSRRAEWNGTQRIRSGPRGAVEPLRQHRGRTVPDITKEKIMNVLDLQSLSTGVRPTGRRFSTWSSGYKNGFALGGGLELAMACDFRLASAAAKFGQPEIALGIIPGFSGTQRLTKLVGTGRASYMIMTGEMIDAKRAFDIGIVEKIIDEDQFEDECAKIAEKMASKSIHALMAGKQTIENGANMDILRGSRLEIESFAQLFSTEDQKEGMSAFLEKRKANFKDS